MALHTCLLAALACANAKRVTLAIANERAHKVRCTLNAETGFVIQPRTGRLLETEVPTELVCGGVTAEIDGDGYVVARVGDDIAVGDANEFQLELSRAAHKCDGTSDFFTPPSFQGCVFRHAFGGVAEADPRAWRLFWQNEASKAASVKHRVDGVTSQHTGTGGSARSQRRAARCGPFHLAPCRGRRSRF